MKLSNTEKVKALKDRREALQSRLKGGKAVMSTANVFVTIRTQRDRKDREHEYIMYDYQDPYTDLMLASLPEGDPRREALVTIITGLILEEIDKIEAELKSLEVTLA